VWRVPARPKRAGLSKEIASQVLLCRGFQDIECPARTLTGGGTGGPRAVTFEEMVDLTGYAGGIWIRLRTEEGDWHVGRKLPGEVLKLSHEALHTAPLGHGFARSVPARVLEARLLPRGSHEKHVAEFIPALAR
jgi:hypothetical protein